MPVCCCSRGTKLRPAYRSVLEGLCCASDPTWTHHFEKNLVRNVPAVPAHRVCRGVTEDDRGNRQGEGLFHHRHRHVSEVDQHPQTVHLNYQLLFRKNKIIHFTKECQNRALKLTLGQIIPLLILCASLTRCCDLC